jgi:signal transduction histidine kinase
LAERPPRRIRVSWFQAKIVGILLAALVFTWFAAVYFFQAGIAEAFNLILQPSIGEGLETAKDRTRDHIEALREQLKWRTERMASEIRRLGPHARQPGALEPLLRRLLAEDAAAFGPPGEEGEGGAGEPGPAATAAAADRRPAPRLIDNSAVDAAGRRVRVRAEGEYPTDVWRLKTFRPRAPDAAGAARAILADALEAQVLCLVGACRTSPEGLLALLEMLRMLVAVSADERAVADIDAAGLEVVFATPWSLFHALDALGDVLGRYKMLRMGGEQVARTFVWVYMLILGFALAVTLTFSVLLARRVVVRVGEIARATRAVAAGNLEVRVAPRGRDEIGDLARSFNEMVTDLKESRDRIAYLGRVSAWQGIARRLAHEIKNPLTPIQLAIQEVAEKYDGSDEKYRRIVGTAREVIEEEVATLRRLTTEFSEFARLPQVQPVVTDLAEFLDDCRAAFSSSAAERGVSIVWHRPPRAVKVPMDRQMMRRVIDNLVRNAIDAATGAGLKTAPEGGLPKEPRVDVEARASADGLDAEIVVRDNGPGISPEAREHLFEPYFTTKQTGTGLGLAIVKKIVLEHGGDVHIDGATVGAVFRVSLPVTPPGPARDRAGE